MDLAFGEWGFSSLNGEISIPRKFCQLPSHSKERNQTFQHTTPLILHENETALKQGRGIMSKKVFFFSPLELSGAEDNLFRCERLLFLCSLAVSDSNGVSLL